MRFKDVVKQYKDTSEYVFIKIGPMYIRGKLKDCLQNKETEAVLKLFYDSSVELTVTNGDPYIVIKSQSDKKVTPIKSLDNMLKREKADSNSNVEDSIEYSKLFVDSELEYAVHMVEVIRKICDSISTIVKTRDSLIIEDLIKNIKTIYTIESKLSITNHTISNRLYSLVVGMLEEGLDSSEYTQVVSQIEEGLSPSEYRGVAAFTCKVTEAKSYLRKLSNVCNNVYEYATNSTQESNHSLFQSICNCVSCMNGTFVGNNTTSEFVTELDLLTKVHATITSRRVSKV